MRVHPPKDNELSFRKNTAQKYDDVSDFDYNVNDTDTITLDSLYPDFFVP